jgi:hypothetical protein
MSDHPRDAAARPLLLRSAAPTEQPAIIDRDAHVAVVATNLAVGGYASVSRSFQLSVDPGPWAAGTAGRPPLGPPVGTVY